MNRIHFSRLFLLLGTLSISLTTGCSKKRALTKEKLATTFVSASNHAENDPDFPIYLGARLLKKKELRKFFGGNTKKIGYKTILLAIKNESDSTFALSAENIGLNLASAEHVTQLLEANQYPWISTILSVASLLGSIVSPLLLGLPLSGAAFGSVYYEMKKSAESCANVYNHTIDSNANYKNLIINPHSMNHFFLFITHNNYVNKFSIKLTENMTKKLLHFNLTLE